jgi:preprotein translocase subunit Sec61beta
MAEQGTQQKEDTGKYHQYLILKTVEAMSDAHAEKDKWKYFSKFRTAYDLLLNYFDNEDREKMEIDFRALKQAIKEIAISKNNEASKKEMIDKIQENFADEHRYYIFNSFAKAGIIRLEQEGSMDFTKHDMEEIKKIVRTGASEANLERIVGEVEIEKV